MADGNGFHRFSHGHHDLLLANGFNFYGTRMVTVSSDHRVKVWNRKGETGQWIVIDVWKAHAGEVTDVRWTGPYVGEHIGTVGEDGVLRIWQEDVNEPLNSGKRFKNIFEQVTATGVPYMALEFKSIGTETYLAAITRDGYISISEPEDHDDQSAWRVMWSDYLYKTPSRMQETSFRLSWHQETLPAWPAILAGLDRKSLSLAAAVGDVVKVFRTDKDRKFYVAAILEGAKDLVRDVSWSNGSMRGFDVIATCSKDGYIRLYELHTSGVPTTSIAGSTKLGEDDAVSLHPPSIRLVKSGIGAGLAGGARGRRDDSGGVPGAVKQDVKLVAELRSGSGTPWRVNWSPAGDLLTVTTDDGALTLWKKADGKWLEAAGIDPYR